MKNSILLPVILLLALNVAMAQQTETKKVHYSVDSDVPEAVLAAVASDFPGMNIEKYRPSPPPGWKQELRSHVQIKNFSEYHPIYYAVIKGREYEKTANYNKDGELLSSTERIKNIAVPRAVLTTLGREYNGWLVTKNQATKFIGGSKNNSVFYEVWLKNGRKKQQLTMDATGKILMKKRPEY